MSIKLGGLIAGVKRAVVEAHRSVSEQHMEELAQYFVPAPGQKPPAKKAAAKHVATATVGVKPVIEGFDGKVVLTLKGGSSFDDPWIVIHANDLQDANDQISGDNAALLVDTMDKLQRDAKKFVELGGGQKGAPAAGAGGGRQPAPKAATEAPNGETRQCKHGDMVYRSGSKNGRAWEAFFCPTPKNTPDQCRPEFKR